MKFKQLILSILVVLLSIFSFNALAVSNPIAWYSFDNSNDLGKDFSANSLDGTNYGAQYQADGVVGGCSYYAGSGQYISVPDNDKLDLTNLTVTFWLKTPDDGYPSGQNRILGKWDNREYGWFGHLYPNGGIYTAMAYGASDREHIIRAKNIGRTEWVNIAIAMTPYSCKIYTNGLLSVSTNFTTEALLSSDASLNIGGFNSWGWAWLKGWLDEVKIWDRILSAEEIAKEANVTPNSCNLIAYYPFNGNANDESGNGHDGTVSGATLTTDRDDNPDSAYDFDGNDDIEIAYAQDLAPTDTISFAAWAYRDDWSGYPSQKIISKTHAGGYSLGSNIDNIPPDNIGAIVYRNNQYSAPQIPTSTLEPGWHYFAGTYDGRYTKFYVDGVLRDTDDAGANYPMQYNYDNSLIVGGEAGATSSEDMWYFDGKVDEVKIWHCALSAEEIAEAMGTNNSDKVDWYEITGSAPWSGRHGLSCTEFGGKIWLLGGLDNSIYNNEIWSSPDGSNWSFNGNAPWSKRGYHATAVFNDKLWIFGGNNPNSGPLNDVWSSSDGSNWTEVISSAPWSTRVGTKSFVYDNKLWIVGGMHIDKTEFCDDVWSSVDGSNWTEVTSSAPWGGRGLHDSFVFNDKMWVMGGCVDGWQKYSKDVWSSSDGTNWTLVTDNASCAERHYSSAAVFDGKIWICGSYHDGEQNDIWSSPDGANWTLVTDDAVWPDRCAQSVFTFNNALWVAGGEGHYNQQLSDVWSTSPYKGDETNSCNLIAYYPFNGNANDESGNGHDGTVDGATLATDRNDNPDSAYDFDGNDDIEIAYVQDLAPTDTISFAAWAYRDDWSTYTIGKVLSSTHEGGYSIGAENIWIPSGNMGAHLFVNDMYLTSYVSTAAFTPGWHYFAATYNGRYFKFYVDGELKSTDDADGNYPIQYDYTAPLIIGGEAGANSAESFWHFDGKVDEVKIWHCALSAEKIAEEANAKSNLCSLIAYYPFNGNANDESGNGHDGTVSGATLTTDGFGNSDSAYAFDGNNDYISVAYDPAMNVSTKLTVSALVKSHDMSQVDQDIISTTQAGGYSLTLNETDGVTENKFAFLLYVDGDYRYVYSLSHNENDKWYYVVGVYNGTEAKIYVNGVLEGSVTLTGTIKNSTSPFIIGNESGQLNEPFNGKIDEVKIYNCALSAEKIAEEAEKYKTYEPFVKITTEDTSVTYDVTEFAVEGSNNINVVGGMTVSNPANQSVAAFDAASGWTAPAISLSVGENRIFVSGTNVYGEACVDNVVITRGAAGTGIPVVDIINEDEEVSYYVTSYSISVSNNVNVVGGIGWENSLTGESGEYPAAVFCSITNIALNLGENIITVYGTNTYGQSTNDTVSIFRKNKLTVLTTELPGGFTGEKYSAVLKAENGDLPYAWSITSGKLPNGILLSADGDLSGTPTTTGLFSFVVRATDKTGGIGEKQLSILVAKKDVSAPRIKTTELPDAPMDEEYFVAIKAVGGTTPYSWEIESGFLPAGLILKPNHGVILGTPTAKTNAFFIIKVTDKNNQSAVMPLVIRVKDDGDQTVTVTDIPRAKFMINWRKHIKGKDDVDNVYLRMLFEVPDGLELETDTPLTVFFGAYPIDGFEAKVTKSGRSAVYHEGSVKDEDFPLVKMVVRIRTIHGQNKGYLYAVVKRADLWGELGAVNETVTDEELVVPIQLLIGTYEGSTTIKMEYKSRKNKKAKGTYPPIKK